MSNETSINCGICGCSAGKLHQLQENMFGLKGLFHYFECEECGALQITDPPEDMSRYYPSDKYYSLQNASRGSDISRKSGLKTWISSKRNEAQLFDNIGLGSLLVRLRPWSMLNEIKSLVCDISARSFSSKILDVGCGQGTLLDKFAMVGFTHLTGIDPYLEGDKIKPNGVNLRKCTLDQMNSGNFDFIMFNHSLEHMEDQIATLSATRNALAAEGICMVEIPISGSEAWREYGTNWVEIDAPRHYCLHTVESMRRVAERAGLYVYKINYVGTSLQFWGSELYQKGLTLHDACTNKIRDPLTVFTTDQMAFFEEKTAKTNAAGTGGRAAFYLRHR